jgi:hypothetical protein
MRKLCFIPVIVILAGCGDTAETLSRDYRNINNEVIDALMMVTNENRAKIANEKVIGPYTDRIGAVDKRADLWEQNKEREEVAITTLTSESVAILFAENKWNQKRLNLELERLKQLHGQLQAQNPGGTFTNLAELAAGGKTAPVLTNMKSGGKFTTLIGKFPNWKLKAETLEFKKVLADKLDKFDMK